MDRNQLYMYALRKQKTQVVGIWHSAHYLTTFTLSQIFSVSLTPMCYSHNKFSNKKMFMCHSHPHVQCVSTGLERWRHYQSQWHTIRPLSHNRASRSQQGHWTTACQGPDLYTKFSGDQKALWEVLLLI